MPQFKNEIVFADPKKEGLSSDIDELLMPSGFSRYRLNCRSGSAEGENVGVIENVKGNVLVSYSFPSGVDFKTIGSVQNISDLKLYYFVWASDGRSHSILEYNLKQNTIQLVARETVFNFSEFGYINNPKYVDGNLLWINNRIPCRINIQKALNKIAGVPAGIDSYGTIDQQVLDIIKSPPTNPLDIEYQSDTTRDYNNLRGNMYQFSYQYVYDDNSKSVWSTYSKVGKPLGDELPDGSFFEDQTVNNNIKVTLETGTIEVKRINLAVREANDAIWKQVESLDKYDSSGNVLIASNTTYDYYYYGDKKGIAISETDFARPYDYVPIEAGAQEIIREKFERLVYGDIIEGYDNVRLDAVITPRQEIYSLGNVIVKFTVTDLGTQWQVDIPIPIITGNVYVANVEMALPAVGSIVVREKAETGDTIGDVRTRIVIALNDAINEYLGTTAIGYAFTSIPTNRYFVSKIPSISNTTGQRYDTLDKVLQPKGGAYHQLGIVYYDKADRRGFVNIDGIYPDIISTDDIKGRVYIPHIAGSGITYTNSYPYYVFDWRVRHIPPVWATHWQWVYSLNQSVSSFLQYYINNNEQISRDTKGYLRVKLNDQITVVNERAINSIIGTYQWQKGDRARISYKIPNLANIQTSPVGKFIDIEILGQDSSTEEILLPDFSPENYGLLDSAHFVGFVIEVYTPRKEYTEETQPYFEVGERFEIGNPGTLSRYHKGETQDQDPSNPSIVSANGKVWI